MITNPTNSISGDGRQGRDFLYLLEQVKKLAAQAGLNDRAIEDILARLDGHSESFATESIEAFNGLFGHITASRLSLKRNLIQRIGSPGDYVIAAIGDSTFAGTYGPIPVAGTLQTTKDAQIAFEGTAVPVSGRVVPTAPVAETAGGPAITWISCPVANKEFEILVLWTSKTCIALYSQNAAIPVSMIGVISRTTGNAPGDPSRLVLRLTPEAFADTFEVHIYSHSINAVSQTEFSYREPINESVDGYARLDRQNGFSMSEILYTDGDFVNMAVDRLTRLNRLIVTGTSAVPTAELGDSSGSIASTEFVSRVEQRLDGDIGGLAGRIDNIADDADLGAFVSGDSGNAMTLGRDKKLFVHKTGVIVGDLISRDDNNPLVVGADNGLFVDLAPVRNELAEAIETEAQNRQVQVDELNNEIIATNKVLSGTHTVTYNGVFQGNIGDTEILDASLIPGQTAVIAPGKAVFFDAKGSVATYIGDMGIVKELPEIWVAIKSRLPEELPRSTGEVVVSDPYTESMDGAASNQQEANREFREAINGKIEGQNIAKYVSTTEAVYNALKEAGRLEPNTVYQYEGASEPAATLIGRWTTPFNQVVNNWDGSVIRTGIPFVDAVELNFIISAMQGVDLRNKRAEQHNRAGRRRSGGCRSVQDYIRPALLAWNT